MPASQVLKAISYGVLDPSLFDTPEFANSSIREVMVKLSPRATLWYTGVFTLDLLSCKLH
jgi:hypothetical protein